MMLRPYQEAAVEAVYHHLRTKDNNPCVVIPTAGGKTHVYAAIVRDAVEQWGGRVIVLSHVKELLRQAADKISVAAPGLDLGIYSAGLGRRDTGNPCVIAGIQSVYDMPEQFGARDLVIIDEAHTLGVTEEGIYRRFLRGLYERNRNLRVLGLTATPYRSASGLICKPENVLNEICYEVGVRDLLKQGYISKLRSKVTKNPLDFDEVPIRQGEFAAEAAEKLMNRGGVVTNACAELLESTRNRRSVLVFCSGVAHAIHVAELLRQSGDRVECVFGDTPDLLRDGIVDAFKSGQIKFLVNVGVFTVGFDAPCVDCVAILRPTNSPGLYYQIVGRGFRLAPDKEDCLILDFGGNIVRHGPVDQIATPEDGVEPPRVKGKTCPECFEGVGIRCEACPACGHRFVKAEVVRKPHAAVAGTREVVTGDYRDHPVFGVNYSLHVRRDATANDPRTMRVDYITDLPDSISEWVCPEHNHPTVKRKFLGWWRRRSSGGELPDNAEETVRLANSGILKTPKSICVKPVGFRGFPEIIGYDFNFCPERQIHGGGMA